MAQAREHSSLGLHQVLDNSPNTFLSQRQVIRHQTGDENLTIKRFQLISFKLVQILHDEGSADLLQIPNEEVLSKVRQVDGILEVQPFLQPRDDVSCEGRDIQEIRGHKEITDNKVLIAVQGKIRGTPHPLENDLQNFTIDQGKAERFVRLPRVLETVSSNSTVSGKNKVLDLMMSILSIFQNEFHCFSCCFQFDEQMVNEILFWNEFDVI